MKTKFKLKNSLHALKRKEKFMKNVKNKLISYRLHQSK